MIQRISILIILIIGVLFSMNENKTNIFVFYKVFEDCEDPITGRYMGASPQEKYKNMKININKNNCKAVNRIFEEEDKYSKQDILERISDQDSEVKSDTKYDFLTSTCFFKQFKIKIEKQEKCILNMQWPFEYIYLVNNKYLIMNVDGNFYMYLPESEFLKIKDEDK